MVAVTVLAGIGMAYLIGAPIAAVFLFGHEEKAGWLPPGNDLVPVVYPADEMHQEKAPK